jgi:hypothetical protein
MDFKRDYREASKLTSNFGVIEQMCLVLFPESLHLLSFCVS